MLAFGTLVGLLFPPLAALVLETHRALSPYFFTLCILAGFVVGHVNYLLFKRVVSRELERVVGSMKGLLGAVEVQQGEVRDHLEPLEVTSSDAIGAVAETFNAMTEAVVRRLEREITDVRQREAHFRFLTETMHELVCLHAPDGSIEYVSPSCEHLLGYTPEEIYRQDPLTRVHPEDVLHFRQGRMNAFSHEALSSLTYRALHKEGHTVWLETHMKVVRGSVGDHVLSTSRDVTERKVAEAALERSALYDALTGLANRVLFMDRLTQALEREKRQPEAGFAVLFLDFDRFKAVNDTLGHAAGDALLHAIGARLKDCVRPTDTVARLGGDEFTVLLENVADIREVLGTVKRIQEVCSHPYDIEGQQVTMTASIGVVTSEVGYVRVDDIVRDADIAMYRAKASGRARYQLFTLALRQEVLGHLTLERDLREALLKGALQLHYQPIVSVESAQPTGFEALARWIHPEHGSVSPQDFIALAEDTGLIVELDRFMLRRACAQVGTWQRRYAQLPPLTLSVNLSR